MLSEVKKKKECQASLGRLPAVVDQNWKGGVQCFGILPQKIVPKRLSILTEKLTSGSWVVGEINKILSNRSFTLDRIFETFPGWKVYQGKQKTWSWEQNDSIFVTTLGYWPDYADPFKLCPRQVRLNHLPLEHLLCLIIIFILFHLSRSCQEKILDGLNEYASEFRNVSKVIHWPQYLLDAYIHSFYWILSALSSVNSYCKLWC